MTAVAIALGSNLGDREQYLRNATAAIGEYLADVRLSSFFETAPVGVGEQPPFLNAALTARTTLPPAVVLERLLEIERRFKRERPYAGAPRTLDLDLILYGDRIVDDPPSLLVPHPRFRERLFVLDPLAEVAGEWIDPVTGKTVEALRRALILGEADRA